MNPTLHNLLPCGRLGDQAVKFRVSTQRVQIRVLQNERVGKPVIDGLPQMPQSQILVTKNRIQASPILLPVVANGP